MYEGINPSVVFSTTFEEDARCYAQLMMHNDNHKYIVVKGI